MDADQVSASALQLARNPALAEVVRFLSAKLTREVMTVGIDPMRSAQALLEYHALQRLVAGIDQLAQNAVTKELQNES